MNAQLFFLHSVLLPLLNGYCWCKERRCVPSAYGRKRANLLGFMNAVTYDTTRVIMASLAQQESESLSQM